MFGERSTLHTKTSSHLVKHGGGGVMVWDCFATSGLGNHAVINGTMNSEMYENICRKMYREQSMTLSQIDVG